MEQAFGNLLVCFVTFAACVITSRKLTKQHRSQRKAPPELFYRFAPSRVRFLSFVIPYHKHPTKGICGMEQATGIEPAFQAWEARILTIELCLQCNTDNITKKNSFKHKKKRNFSFLLFEHLFSIMMM